MPAYLFARQSTVVKPAVAANEPVPAAITEVPPENSSKREQKKPRRRTRSVKFPEQVLLRKKLAQLFPGCNVVWAAKVMGVTKGNAKNILYGYVWLSRERALLIAAALQRLVDIVPVMQELADRPYIDRRRGKYAYDPTTSRWRDTRVARGRIRPQHSPTDDDPGQPAT